MSGRPCLQLVYTSASRTLEGPGFGVFAMSPDWPLDVGRSRKALGALVSSPPEDADASRGPAESYGVLQRASGRLLFRKVAAGTDGFGRPGNHLVHLLWDESSRLGVRDLLALRRAGGFLDGLPADAAPSTDLPPVRVPFAQRAPHPLSTEETDFLMPCLELLLATIGAGAGLCCLPRETSSGSAVGDALFGILPRALVAPVTLRAGASDDVGDTAAVVVELGDHPAPVAYHAGRRLPVTAADTERARTLLEAASKSELPPDELGDLRRLDTWLFADVWADWDVADLTPDQVTCVLQSGASARWLARDRNATVALARAARDPALRSALQTSVHRHPDSADRIRKLVLSAQLDRVFDGADGPGAVAVELAGLTQGDLSAGFTVEVAAGRRVSRVDRQAGLLIEQTLSLGLQLSLLELTGDHAGLAELATSRPLVRRALEAEWRLSVPPGEWDEERRRLLGHLLLADVRWLGWLDAAVPSPALPPVLTWAAVRMDAAGVERLAVAVATSTAAGHGWALRAVVFASELPAPEVDGIFRRELTLLLVDDCWPRDLAASVASGGARRPVADGSARRRTRGRRPFWLPGR